MHAGMSRRRPSPGTSPRAGWLRVPKGQCSISIARGAILRNRAPNVRSWGKRFLKTSILVPNRAEISFYATRKAASLRESTSYCVLRHEASTMGMLSPIQVNPAWTRSAVPVSVGHISVAHWCVRRAGKRLQRGLRSTNRKVLVLFLTSSQNLF